MRQEGGVVGLGDLGCFVVLGLFERLFVVRAAALGVIGGGCVCAVFVVASCVADTIIVDTAVGDVTVVVVVEVAGGRWGSGQLRS